MALSFQMEDRRFLITVFQCVRLARTARPNSVSASHQHASAQWSMSGASHIELVLLEPAVRNGEEKSVVWIGCSECKRPCPFVWQSDSVWPSHVVHMGCCCSCGLEHRNATRCNSGGFLNAKKLFRKEPPTFRRNCWFTAVESQTLFVMLTKRLSDLTL